MLLAAAALAALWLATARSRPQPVPRGVLLLTLDTTRADYLGPWGSRRGASPRLDALASDAAVFLDATTSSPLTRPAHTALLTGASPLQHGVRDNLGDRVPEELETLAERLSRAGFRTLGVVAASVLARDSGLDRGFSHYDDELAGRAERPAEEVAERALRWLEGVGDARFFAWLHFYDPHLPYAPGEPQATRFPDDRYAGEIARMDAAVGSVIDALRASGRLDSTLVIAVADHGEALGAHGEPDHGVFLYQSTLHVPLIVRPPGGSRAGTIRELVRDVDVAPTVLDLLGLPAAEASAGASLRPLLEGRSGGERVAYAESHYARLHYGWAGLRSLRDGRFKYVAAPEPELYDLAQDPGETRDLHSQRAAQASAMAARLAELTSSARAASRGAAPDPAAVERLRALGYVAASLAPESEPASLPDPKRRVASLSLFAEIVPRTLACLAAGECDAAALEALDRVLAAEPRYVEGFVLRSRLLEQLGRSGDAVAALEAALRLNPEDTASLAELAELRARRGESRAALEVLAAAQALRPGDGELLTRQARLLRGAGREREALALLEEFVAQHPRDALARYELGCLRLERGELDEAERLVRAAYADDPGLDQVHFNLALIAEARGQSDQARREYRAELEQRPDNFEAWTNLGVLELESGAPEAAAAAARQVMRLAPELFAGPWLLARAHLAAGRADAEVAALARRALELAPDSPAARQLLAEIERGS